MLRFVCALALVLTGTTFAAVPNRYAALAYSPSTGNLGLGTAEFDTDETGFRAAYAAAFNDCGAKDCIVRAGVRNGCIAWAHDDEFVGMGFVGAVDRDHARQGALFYCQRPWGNNCRLYFEFCTKDLR